MNNATLYEISGEVQEIIFRNDDNGYTVFTLIDNNDEEFTAVGTIPMVNSGELVKLLGKFKSHPSYGSQFAVDVCERTLPSSSTAILRYLSNGAIKGVGPATARRLVEAFGNDTLSIMENEPERVAKVKGITHKKAISFSEEIKRIYGIRELIAHMQKFNIAPHDSVRIWRVFGNKSINIINENPYILCNSDLSIPFSKADAIAQSNNMPQNNTFRTQAGFLHILEHNKRNGHTCLPKDKLIEACIKFLGIDFDYCNEILSSMIIDNMVISEIFDERDFIFLPNMYNYETYISARIFMNMRFPAQQISKIEEQIKDIEITDHLEYASLQKKAITEALSSGLLVLTGGPGTGKTTTLNAIIKILKQSGEKVFLAAPTGRAAQRMSEVTNCEAKTLHRLLEVTWDNSDKPVFKKNERNMLNCDALIIDELSMVDSQLFDSVMRALPMSCRLILVGDSDQLPSVGAGNILQDLITSNVIPVVQLTEIFRQSMESLIVTNAHSIVHGDNPNLSSKDNDFFFLNRNDKEQIGNTIVELCTTRLPKTYGFSTLNDIQILSPSRKGVLGSIDINQRLQSAINPPSKLKSEVSINGITLRLGDKVMQVKNNYNIMWTKKNGENGEGVFNGDIGILTDINKLSKKITVLFDDKTAHYEFESAIDLELAYATTVHKSQGNEFNAVIIPMHQGPPQLYYRNLLYTAVTRAKKILILVGNQNTVYRMVQNNKRTLRYSGLKYFLMRGYE